MPLAPVGGGGRCPRKTFWYLPMFRTYTGGAHPGHWLSLHQMKLKSVARQYKLDYRSERKSQPVEVVKSSTYHEIVLSLKLGDIMLHINRCEMMACAPLTYAADRMWPLNFMKTCY